MTKEQYFNQMPDELLCECIKELTGQTKGNKSLNTVFDGVENETDYFYSMLDNIELEKDILKEAAKRYLKIKMLQS